MRELLSSEENSHLYRPCVGIIVLNQDNFVWVGRRCPVSHDGEISSLLWQMPQGGINIREDPLDAAYRELYEETNIKSVSFLGKGCSHVRYDFLECHIKDNGYRGQIQQWFAFRFEGEEDEICVDRIACGYKSEFDTWAWVPLVDTPDMVVDFKREAYKQVVSQFSYLLA
ncbi:RNA pyrophosphohydrolase [Liberibacter sp. Z1]|nr:RNA pyrophosphohydrolase [Candidatus Liberibacter sp.]